MDLLNMLSGMLTSGDAMGALTDKTGIGSKELSSVINSSLPKLLKSLTGNASSESGAQSLLGALDQHKTTKSVSSLIKDADEEDGAKILSKIFGDSKSDMMDAISKDAGVDIGDVMKILTNISPSILSGISAATSSASKNKAKGFDLSDGFGMDDVMALMGGSSKVDLGSLLGGNKSDSGSDLIGSLLKMMK